MPEPVQGRENLGHAGIEYWGIQAVRVLLTLLGSRASEGLLCSLEDVNC